MGLTRWLTHHVADTDAGTHPDLRPLELPLDREAALRAISAAISGLRRWRVESVEPPPDTVRATRRTPLFRFVDDVTVRVEPTAGGVRVHARSESRVGVGDLGQNRRNILELFRALGAQPRQP